MNRENEKAMFAGKNKSGLTKEQVGLDNKNNHSMINTDTSGLKLTKKEIDIEIEKLWDMVESWLDESHRKSYRSLCRIGSTIEKKNDQKRVEESRLLEKELKDLSDIFFMESGLAEKNGLKPEDYNSIWEKQ